MVNFDLTLAAVKKLISDNSEDLLFQICQELKKSVCHYDWVGFYLLRDGELQLGPFVGKATEHTRIPIGKGVCGQVAVEKKTIVVQKVSEQDNYIACSLDVQSEIVVPILKNDKFVAEIDIDSHSAAPFTEKDEQFLETICSLVSNISSMK